MKKIILMMLLFTAFTAAVYAQKGQQKTAEERAKQATEVMAKELSLTPEQKTSVYEAALERAKAVDAEKVAAGEGNKPNQAKMTAIAQKFGATMKTILTEEQKAKQKANAEELKAKKQAAGQ